MIVMSVTVALWCAVAPTMASAAQRVPLSPQLRAQAIRAVMHDPDVRQRMRLRPGTYRVADVTAVTFGDGGTFFGLGGSSVVEVRLRASDGSTYLRGLYNTSSRQVRAVGQALLVMPGTAYGHGWSVTSWWYWACAAVVLIGLIALGGIRDRAAWLVVLGPCALIAVLFWAQLHNWIPSHGIRGWNIALYGAFTAAMVVSGVAAVWYARGTRALHERRVREMSSRRLVRSVLAALTIAGVVVAGVLAHGLRQPFDVAYASTNGAELMAGGARVYGNTNDIPSFIANADTYGPMAYLAYVPAALVRDDVRGIALGTNVVLFALLVACAVALGKRCGGWTRGLWCGALLAWYPPLALGALSGNNDIVPALLVALLMLTLHMPAVRSACAVAAGATKYVPIVLLAFAIRHRCESRGAALRAVAMAVVVGVLLTAVAVHDLHGARVFAHRIADAQLSRDDIVSIWGLTGWHDVRYVFLAGCGAVTAYGAYLGWRRGRATVPWTALAALTFGYVALPQFYAPYVSVLVPLALVTLLDARAVRA